VKVLVLASSGGPDYLADLFFCELIHSERYDIDTNHLPPYFYSDFAQASSLYGNGYTAFTKLDRAKSTRVNLLDTERILKCVKSSIYDAVVYTSIWRFSDHFDEICCHMPKKKIIVLDGEDHTKVASIALRATYYKRELTKTFEEICLPISFTYPSYFTSYKYIENIAKSTVIAPCFPYFKGSY